MLKLCLALRDQYNIAAVTNDIFTKYASLLPPFSNYMDIIDLTAKTEKTQSS